MPDPVAAAAADPNIIYAIIKAIFDPANIVAVAVVGVMFIFYKITSQRFELEAQEQKDIINKIGELERKITVLEIKLENLHDHKQG